MISTCDFYLPSLHIDEGAGVGTLRLAIIQMRRGFGNGVRIR
jgi:hypothetical protein